MKIEDIEIDDLVYKSSDTGIELTNHSRIIINSIPIEDENGNITIGIYSYNDNTQKCLSNTIIKNNLLTA